MKYYIEDSLSNFKFWSGGKSNADLLSVEQLDTVEVMLGDIEPENGWSDTAINDLFWFDFNTICVWLGYESVEHLEKDITNDDLQEAESWAEDMSDNYDELFLIAGLDKDQYIFEDEDGDEDMDCYSANRDFIKWWDKLDDFEKVEQYRKYQLDKEAKEVENATLERYL